jgi:hypothetical protein
MAMHRVSLCVAVAIAVATISSAWASNVPSKDQVTPGDAMAFLGVRVLKTPDAGTLSWSVQLPTRCAKCRLVINQYTSAQNSKDFFFHFYAPTDSEKVEELHLAVDPAKVRGVLVGRTDTDLAQHAFGRMQEYTEGMASVPFRRVRDGIVFDVPLHPNGAKLPPGDAGDVTELYTFIETPGVSLRVGHADEARRRGAYGSGAWPVVEAQAALNLEFAARGAITLLGLDRALAKNGVATILLMNFDTNAPTQGPYLAHLDSPPHWHMHLYWTGEPKIRKVGHFFIGPKGLLAWNFSNDLQRSPEGDAWYNAGEPDATTSAEGEVLYTHTITQEGFFELSSQGATCRFNPAGRGFDSGVDLTCSGHATVHGIHVLDDVSAGQMEVYAEGRRTAHYTYDIDTGALKAGGSQ